MSSAVFFDIYFKILSNQTFGLCSSMSGFSSPDWYICRIISLPPINSPLTQSCGKVGRLAMSGRVLRISGFSRILTKAKGLPIGSAPLLHALKIHIGETGACLSYAVGRAENLCVKRKIVNDFIGRWGGFLRTVLPCITKHWIKILSLL